MSVLKKNPHFLKFQRQRQYLRTRIIVIVLIAILIPSIMFMFYTYSIFKDYFYSIYVEGSIKQTLNHLGDSVINNLRTLDNTQHILLSSQTIRTSLYELNHAEKSYYLTQKVKLNIENELKYILSNDYAFNHDLIDSVFVCSSHTYFYLLSDYLPNDTILKEAQEFHTNYTNDSKEVIRYYPTHGKIYFSKTITDYVTDSVLGMLIIGVDYKALKGFFDQSDHKEWTTAIFDNQNIYRFHTDPNQIGITIPDDIFTLSKMSSINQLIDLEGDYLAITEEIRDLNFKAITYVPKSLFQSEIWRALPDYIYFVLFSILIAVIVGIYAVSYMTVPLKKITEHIEETISSHFKTKMPTYKYKELNELSCAYNDMIDQIQYLFSEVYEKQILVRESELKALHAQINPHFMFNVLESIIWEARQSENEKIEQMITALSQLLRNNLTFSNQDKVTLEQELDYVNFYLYLQTLRFSNRLKTKTNLCSDDLLKYKLPKFSIQTLIENAIIHGIECKMTSSFISINVKENDSDLIITVQDDGVGFDVSQLNWLSFKEAKTSVGSHVGLNNINNRIRLLYGSPYGITITSEAGVGTLARIIIPKDMEV
ncbi:sensor histidine kinase [Fusibacter sp. 3D3]|uniref:sensor histidine kinase n=1 Tax=Fusibacter sp. 3D3 TaxID=1048380 RepID=UPI000852EA19|nr:sensor histidine kinase [Fusibacter sp. 3D3]GAU75559.1 autolysis histidine kinase LytS [Fusibacter sp. 3D3]